MASRQRLKIHHTPFEIVYNAVVDALDFVLRPLQRRIGQRNMAYVFVLPNVAIFVVFVLFPMLMNFYYAFTGGSNIFPDQRPFVGLQNFETIFSCTDYTNPNTCREDLFWKAAFNTFGFVVLQVGAMVVASLVTALALNRKIRARGFFRSVFFYPVLLSPVVIALIWRWILQNDGLLNGILIGLGGERVPFLTNPDWARFWVIFISVWSQMGFYTLILLAGLQSIPHELYEAGQIDGANPLQSFRSITLPLLMPTMLVVLVLSLIRAVQVFDQVYAFTNGGPGTATTYMIQYVYLTAFAGRGNQYGLAAAASVILAVVLLIFTLLQLRMGRQSELSV
jgi:alpha-1,4-digalacturonate transport system permease protein